MRIVASKHHLSTHLQLHGLIHRETLLLELTSDSTLVGVFLSLNLSKTLLIDVISSSIERSKCDDCPILFCRLADTLVEMHQNLWCRLVQANALKDFEECLIFLAIHLLELNFHQSHALDHICLVEETVIRMIEVVHQIAFSPFLQYWRQLEHITHEDHLLTSKRKRRAQRLPHRVVDSVNDVATHHRDLIYNNGVRMDQRQDSRLTHLPHRAWCADIHRQSEKRVNGITTC